MGVVEVMPYSIVVFFILIIMWTILKSVYNHNEGIRTIKYWNIYLRRRIFVFMLSKAYLPSWVCHTDIMFAPQRQGHSEQGIPHTTFAFAALEAGPLHVTVCSGDIFFLHMDDGWVVVTYRPGYLI